MREFEKPPLSCIVPNDLIVTKIQGILDETFLRGGKIWDAEELANIYYFEEGEEVEFGFLPTKPIAKVTKFSWMSRSFELNAGRTEIVDIARDYGMMKIMIAHRIANYIEERIVILGEESEVLFYSCPIRPESGRLYGRRLDGSHGIYYSSELIHQKWDLSFRVDLFLTPVIYPRDWGTL